MKKRLLFLLLTAIILAIFFGSFSPNEAKLPVYLVLFSIIYLFSTQLFSIIIDLAYAKIPKRSRRFAAIVLGFSPTVLLALASLSSITVVDFILAIGIPTIIVWYGLRGAVIK
jgi:hypothetical protein